MGKGVVDRDQAIDELTAEIELAAWNRLQKDRPGWEQLQRAVGVLLILPELERSADLAEHIAQRSLTGVGAEMTAAQPGHHPAHVRSSHRDVDPGRQGLHRGDRPL